MNRTIVTPFPGTWRRFGLRYVSLAAGLALAAGVAIAAWPTSDSTSSPRQISAALTVPPASADQPATVMYVVGSEAQAAALRAVVAEAGQEVAAGGMTVLVADPADEAMRRQLRILFEDYASGVLQNVQVIDLRKS
jgi:hypothetical protein